MQTTILTWNVNGLRAVERKGELAALLAAHRPDLLLLQEIKGRAEQFGAFLTKHDDYAQHYHSAAKPGYAGTGLWLRRGWIDQYGIVPHFFTEIPAAPNDDEGRVVHGSFVYKNVTHDILSVYFPNGGKSRAAWEEKLVFFDRTLDFMNALRAQGHTVIVGGDMNVAHQPIDLARPKENDGDIGFHPDERAWMDRVMADGWVDVWRAKNPDVTEVYSYWDSFTRARERNVGWRIDYFFADHSMLSRVMDVRYVNEQYGSDHCPLLLRIDL